MGVTEVICIDPRLTRHLLTIPIDLCKLLTELLIRDVATWKIAVQHGIVNLRSRAEPHKSGVPRGRVLINVAQSVLIS